MEQKVDRSQRSTGSLKREKHERLALRNAAPRI